MKRTIVYTALALALAGSIAFAVHAQQKGAEVTENCPCTPDCQPGDPHCTCPAGCEK